MKNFFVLIFCLTIWLPAGVDARVVSLPLKDFMAVDNIRLSGIEANTQRFEFKLPIPERWKVHKARLTFGYTNSSALIKDRSKLIFVFDGFVLAQNSLDPLVYKKKLTVPIPPSLLGPGYHPFEIQVAQHSVETGCEDPSAPELWTSIELVDAVIELEMDMKDIPLRVSSVNDFLYDPKNIHPPDINLIFPELTPGIMKSVTLCATGIANRYEYRRTRFFNTAEISRSTDTILVGDPEFLKSKLSRFSLPDSIWKNIQGPQLSLHHLPYLEPSETSKSKPKADPRHALMIVSGRNEKEILKASTALSLLSMPLPDASSLHLTDIQVPTLEPYRFKNGLVPGCTYSLKALGMDSFTFKGMTPIPKGIEFRVPSNSHLTPNDQAVLSLTIAYGAAMREDSVLNIQLNDKFVAGIPLKDPSGGKYRDYEVDILMSSLRPGINRLLFAPELVPLITDQCTLIQTGNLKMTLFDNSTLSLPEIDHWIEMPNLGALLTDGFPFGRYPDMRETQIVVPDKTPASFMASVNLIAMTSQKIGFPPLAATWHLDTPVSGDKDLILVSQHHTIPQPFREAAPIDLTTPGPIKMPHLGRPKGDCENNSILSNFFHPRQEKITRVAIEESKLVVLRADPVLTQGRGACIEFQNPKNQNRSVFMLTAQNEKDMAKTGQALWDPRVQASLRGDTAFINLTDPELDTRSFRLGDNYYLGKVSPIPFMDYYANTYPLWFIGVIAILCFSLAMLLYMLLRARNKRRLTGE
ncbi:MAG: cellulose biosynthesis cyclic di-GMP-binding regulatory protein BcsB [Desulfobacter sp.]|nr:cellulose biosynthesis cyclic di-GMP-binding regulatory protein BcsB [Desulfobacter sp.]